MKKISFNKGFTLIELLVVVAIIGLLTSVVLVSLTSAKNKGGDTSVKSNLHTTKLAAEGFFLDNGSSYVPSGGSGFAINTCPTYASGTSMFAQNKVIADSIAEAVKRGNGSSCYSSANFWAVAVGLKSAPNTSWCVDTFGVAKMVNFVASEAIDPSTFVCK